MRKRSDNVKAMKGGIRRPRTDGQSYSFVLDVGLQDAQRCDACGRRGRFWVGAKLLQACPVCGGEVHATRERRVIEKSGFASFKDAELARAEELVKRGRGGYIIPARITTAAWLRQWLAGLNRELEARGFNYLLFLRLVPLFPFFLVNLAAGLTRLPLRTFVLGTMVGIIPGGFVYVNAGASLATIGSLRDVASPRVLGSFALLGLFALVPVIYGKLGKKGEPVR